MESGQNFYIPRISTIYWFILDIFVRRISLRKKLLGFPYPGIQPNHMRKKSHRGLNKDDTSFDKFYLIKFQKWESDGHGYVRICFGVIGEIGEIGFTTGSTVGLWLVEGVNIKLFSVITWPRWRLGWRPNLDRIRLHRTQPIIIYQSVDVAN